MLFAKYIPRFVMFCLALSLPIPVLAQSGQLTSLRQAFQDPPADCRIMMRWWWFGGAVEKPELERELRAMKDGGIGGVELQFVYPLALDDPEHGFRNLPYLSDGFIDAVRFTADKARELGLRVDLTLGSGWPYGGPHVPVTHAAGKLRYVAVPVPPGALSIPVPSMGAGEKLLATFLARSDQKISVPADALPESQIQNGRLLLPAGLDGSHTVHFFISSRTGMMVKRPAIGAEGFVLDHFDRAAIDLHLHAVGDRLLDAFGDHPPYAVFSDSLEVYESDWTAALLEQFRQRRGYDLTPYLPALAGDAGPVTADIRHDWGRTLTELIQDEYLTPLREWAAQHGTKFRSQSYGVPAVTLSSNALADLPEGEGEQWRQFAPTRWASSANHLFGRPVTSSETWTWLHSPAFRATPMDMKAVGDLFFLQGSNLLIGHGWPYSPESAGNPGWRFYASAAFNDHNPWWMVMPEVTKYLQRTSYALRLGKPANDVALLLPTDDAWSRFTLGHDSVSQAMEALLGPSTIPQILDAGYNFDFIDAQAIDQVGIHCAVLVLPNVERLPLATYRKIEAYAKNGGIVIATGNLPSFAPGLQESKSDTPEIAEISHRLFQIPGAPAHFVSEAGQLGAALKGYLKPDVSMAPLVPEIGIVHRKLPSADLYFLANTSNQPVRTAATFRVSGKNAEWWDPMTGTISPAGTSATVALDLQPYESRIVVFSMEMAPAAQRPRKLNATQKALPAPVDLASNWTLTFPGIGRTAHLDTLQSWADDKETQFYSGSAVYEKTVAVSAAQLKPGIHVYLDFGTSTPVERPQGRMARARAWLESPVREAAQVYVNESSAGSVWHPPYEVDVTKYLNVGENHLRIVVGNLGINALAGQAPPDYRLLKSRYGDRFQAQDMENLQPLPSGLLGPVRLVFRDAEESSSAK